MALQVTQSKFQFDNLNIDLLKPMTDFPMLELKYSWQEDQNFETDDFICDSFTIIDNKLMSGYRNNYGNAFGRTKMNNNKHFTEERVRDFWKVKRQKHVTDLKALGWFNVAEFGESFSNIKNNYVSILQNGNTWICVYGGILNLIFSAFFGSGYEESELVITLEVAEDRTKFNFPIIVFYLKRNGKLTQFAMTTRILYHEKDLRVINSCLKIKIHDEIDYFEDVAICVAKLNQKVEETKTKLRQVARSISEVLNGDDYKNVTERYKDFLRESGKIKSDCFGELEGLVQQLVSNLNVGDINTSGRILDIPSISVPKDEKDAESVLRDLEAEENIPF